MYMLLTIIITHSIQNYRLPRLSAINTMIAGPAVITRKREISCNKVVGLKNIIQSPMIKSVCISLIIYNNFEILNTYIVYSNTFVVT
jgi:hypothetical protein